MDAEAGHSVLARRRAFTLLELLVAMVILTIAMSITFQAFSSTLRGWKRGMEVIDGIKHGDFAMGQLASALNSTLYFFNPRKNYAFLVEKDTANGLPADTLSFVTVSGAFMPVHSPFATTPHRLKLYIEDDDRGHPALFAIAMPAIAGDEESIHEYEAEYAADPYLVSRSVQGLEILFYDAEEEEWVEEWEEENSIPERIQLMVYVASDDADEEPIVFTRTLEIPVATSVKAKLKNPTSVGPGN